MLLCISIVMGKENRREKSSRSGGGSRARDRHLSGLATGVCGNLKALWLFADRQFVHPNRATILGALRFGDRRVPLQYRPLDTAHAVLCCLGAAGHDLPRCVAPLVGPPNVFPSAAMLRDCDARCAGLAIEASYAFQGLRQETLRRRTYSARDTPSSLARLHARRCTSRNRGRNSRPRTSGSPVPQP